MKPSSSSIPAAPRPPGGRRCISPWKREANGSLLRSIARELIERDWIDRDAVARHRGFSGTRGAARVLHGRRGRPRDAAQRGADRAPHRTGPPRRRVSFWWSPEQVHGPGARRRCRGPSSTSRLMTGNIGRPGTGRTLLAAPATEQAPAVRQPVLASRRPDLRSSEHRLDAAKAAGPTPPGRLPEEAGAQRRTDPADIDAGVIRGLAAHRHQLRRRLVRQSPSPGDPEKTRLPGRAGHSAVGPPRSPRRTSSCPGPSGAKSGDVHHAGATSQIGAEASGSPAGL